MTPYKIICLDDEPEILELMGELVSEIGFTPVLTTTSAATFRALEDSPHQIILVLCDYKMPEMTGFEIRKRMNDRWKQIPFVIVSGFITREMALEAVDLKISAFCDKPFSGATLSEIILRESKDRIAALKEDKELLTGFVTEAQTMTGEMETLILSLDEESSNAEHNNETINRIFTFAHTIKGSSGFFKPDTVHKFTHKFEDFLSQFKKQTREISPEAVSILLKAVDTIRSLLTQLHSGQQAMQPLDELLKLFQMSQPLEGNQSKKDAAPKAAPAPDPAPARDEIKVPTEMLDKFMGLSSEITVLRNMINKLVKKLERDHSGNKDISLLDELLDEMHKINGSMQEEITDIRKVALDSVYRPIPRAMRDLGASLKKEITLELHGGEIRVDHILSGVLSNSLIHMVRNSADHGLESTAERQRIGKPLRGKISIRASELNGWIFIKITDDGRGLNTELIKKKLVENGLRSPEQIRQMSAPELHGMIFEPGFSTAAVVTDISGRGVGTDMVKRSVTAIGGEIEIESTAGKGATFTLKLPIPRSVVIISSLLVRIKNQQFAIPQDRVVRMLTISSAGVGPTIKSTEDAEFLELEHKLYPVVDVARLFSGTANQTPMTARPAERQLVLVQGGFGNCALEVDEIIDFEDTVIKSLGKDLRSLEFLEGATFLADGSVGMILNMDGLARLAGLQQQAQATPTDLALPDSEKSTTPLARRPLLLFSLEAKGLYGVALNEVHRLEEFKSSEIRYSGEQAMMIYLGRPMPLYQLQVGLGLSAKWPLALPETLPTIVVKIDGKNTGWIVRELLDLQDLTSELDTGLASQPGILGSCVLESRAVTLISVLELNQESK